jgi:hypothetical protein
MYLKKIKLNKIKSSYLIEDNTDNESDNENNVTWSEIESNIDCTEEEEEELDEDDEIVNLDKLNNKKEVNEIKFEIIKDNKNNKCVNVCVSLDLESYNIINIEFLISKEIILKLANQLK